MDDQQSTPDAHNTDNLLDQNQLLSQEIRRRVDQLSAINMVAATVSQTLDLEVTMQTALDAVLGVIKVDSAGISLVNEAASELVLRAQRGWKYDFVTQPMRIPLSESMSAYVIDNDTVLVTGDLADDPRLAVPEFADEGVQAMAMVPMHAQGHVIGILSVMNHQAYEFTPEEITVLQAVADQVGIAIDNARLYENIKEQSSRLNAILNSSGDAIIATDSSGHINWVNATAAILFDLSPENIIGQLLRDAPLHPKLREGLRRAMSDESDGNTVFEVTLESGRFLSAIVSPVYAHQSPESNQEAEGWVMVIQDVTHLREAERTRVNFIHAAAHDLRNPLSVTLSALTMLEKDLSHETDLYKELIDLGVQGLNRMQDLIDSLLSLEHVESGVGLQRKPVNVRELIERGVVDIQPCLQQREQTLGLEIADEELLIQGDMHWLYRAFTNLLSNANKYTQMGGEITVCAYQQDADLYLEVHDNGPGIPPEAQTRLFERFYRVPSHEHTDHTIKGSGLGLAIVKSVVEQHGGRVFFQNKTERGSIFGMIFSLTATEHQFNATHDATLHK